MLGGPMGALVGGSLGGGVSGYFGEKEAREADLSSAREQMAFQERMSSTSHRREVEDLRAAGLNPALSANSGASTPVGTSIDAENLLSGVGPSISNSVSSAVAMKGLNQNIKESNSRIGLNNATREKTLADALMGQVTAGTAKTIFDLPEKLKSTDLYKRWMRYDPFSGDSKKYLEERYVPQQRNRRLIRQGFRNRPGRD